MSNWNHSPNYPTWDISRGIEIPESLAPFVPTGEQSAFTRFWQSQGTWNPIVDVAVDWCEPLDPMYRVS